MSLHNRRRDRFADSEDVNPMNYVSNLSDVMLIFAVGIMVALIMHWGVDVTEIQATTDTAAESYSQIDESQARTFTEEEREQMQNNATEGDLSEGMQKTGEVYYDSETGTYYIVESRNEADAELP